MRSIVTCLCLAYLLLGSCVLLGAEKNTVLEFVKNTYEKAEMVFLIKDGHLTIYKESLENKVPREIKREIDMVVFDVKPLLRLKDKNTITEIGSFMPLMITDEKAIIVPLFGKASTASITDVEKLLKELAKADNFEVIEL